MADSKDLLQVLWSGADVLRGKMDANEYKTYLLGLVFYKYLSDSYPIILSPNSKNCLYVQSTK